jgi:hypothetical protein
MDEVIGVFTRAEFTRLRLAVMDRRDKLRNNPIQPEGLHSQRVAEMVLLDEKMDNIKNYNDIRDRADQWDLLEAIEKSNYFAIKSDRDLIMAVHEEKLIEEKNNG